METVKDMCFTVDAMFLSRCSDRAIASRRCITAALAVQLLLACSVTEPEIDPEPEPASDEVQTCLDPDRPRTEVPDFPLTYATEHLDIYVDEERFLCAGTALEYERFVDYVSEQLGVEIQRRIPLYFGDHAATWCSLGAGTAGCATEDGTIFAEPRASYHELTHAVACETRFPAAHMFAEGLATAFEPQENEWRTNPTEFSDIETKFSYYYHYAGHFVRWLHEQLGSEVFMHLYAHANYDTGIWAAIVAAYGATAESDYLERSPALWVPHRQCADLPLIEPVNGVWSFESRFDCDDPSTLGPYERTYDFLHDQDIYQSFLIEIDEPGTYRIERPPSELVGETEVYIERCLDDHPGTKEEAQQEWVQRWVWYNFYWVEPNDIGWEELPYAGLWRVDVVRKYGPPVDMWLKIAREADGVTGGTY
jgi:hypothetical protein